MPYGSVCGPKGNLDQVPKRSLSLIIILDGENREEEWSRETSSTKLSMSLSRPHRRNQDFENYLSVLAQLIGSAFNFGWLGTFHTKCYEKSHNCFQDYTNNNDNSIFNWLSHVPSKMCSS